MHFLGIVASHRANSHSRQFCEWVFEGVRAIDPGGTREMLELFSVNIRPCQSCGHCGRVSGDCSITGDGFVGVRDRLARADGIVVVSPHYAPIPAKLSMLLERLESTHFFASYYRKEYRGPLHGIPYGIVAHGAGPGVKSYKAMVLDTIENAGDTIGLRLIRRTEFPENGFFVPAENSPDLTVYPPQQVYREGIREGLNEYGSFLAKACMEMA